MRGRDPPSINPETRCLTYGSEIGLRGGVYLGANGRVAGCVGRRATGLRGWSFGMLGSERGQRLTQARTPSRRGGHAHVIAWDKLQALC